jgi:hypothetical protein
MNQPMLTFPSSNLLLRARIPSAQGPYFVEKNTSDPAHFAFTEINRWIARWENEGGAVRLGRSDDQVTILLNVEAYNANPG